MKKTRTILAFGLLAVLLVVLIVWNINAGSVPLSPGEILSILLTRGAAEDTPSGIIWSIRLPRILAAVLLGGALSVSGFLLQTFFANPIAGPFVLGISSGAKLVVALTMVFCLGRGLTVSAGAMVAAAFVGSLISTGFILLISHKVQRMSMLIVGGVMIGYICSAITDFVVTFAEDSNIVNLHNWSLGSFSGTDWKDLTVMAPLVLVAVLASFLLSKPMGAYQMGEVYAQNMGVNVARFRVALILLSSLLSATATAFAGPISFVGVAIPHLIRGLFKTAKPIIVIPASFLGGAVFCLFCDLIARTLFAPTDLSIGSVTALLGAPVVISLMVRRDADRR